jgi:hypothetical protein
MFVFAASVVLRIGNEGAILVFVEGYSHLVSWADKTIDALLPPSPLSSTPLSSTSRLSATPHPHVPAPNEKNATVASPRPRATAGRVMAKTVTRTTMAVARTAAALPRGT